MVKAQEQDRTALKIKLRELAMEVVDSRLVHR